MSVRHVTSLFILAASVAVTLPARGTSLGEAVSRELGAEGFASLAAGPPERLAALHRASDLLAARAAGVLPAQEADILAAGAVLELAASLPALASADAQTVAAALAVEQAVVGTELRKALVGLAPGDEGPLVLAAFAWTQGLAELSRMRVNAGGDEEGLSCFADFVKCMDRCSDLETAFERSICGLDCAVTLASCINLGVRYPDDPRRPVLQRPGLSMGQP